MIESFGDKETEKVFNEEFSKKLPEDIQEKAKVQLDRIDAAMEINFLRIPPSNKLKKLSGKQKDFWSIRVNNQWRIVFKFSNQNAQEVKITDYH